LPAAALIASLRFALLAGAPSAFTRLLAAAHAAAFLLPAAAFIRAFAPRRAKRRRRTALPGRLLPALLGEGVIVQLALLAQQFRQAPHRISQLLLLGRQFALFALGLPTGHALPLLPRAALLELEILEHVGDVGEQLARLITCAGLGEVLQSVQHILEVLPAEAFTARLRLTVFGGFRRVQPVGNGLRHLRGHVFIGRVAERFHQPADFFFRSPVPQRALQRSPRRFQPPRCVRRAAIFQLQRNRP